MFFTEDDLKDYDTLLKVYPPLRTKKDQAALLAAIENGTVDCISSHHIPQDWDAKTIEFEYAKAGIACIETSFATIHQMLPHLPDDRIAALFSLNARKIFSLQDASIKEGNNAELTIFNKKDTTLYTAKDSKSKSANSPFWNVSLSGKVNGTVVKGVLHLNQ